VDVFGSFALLLAFVCELYALLGASRPSHAASPSNQKHSASGIAACCLIFLATLSVVYLFVTDQFFDVVCGFAQQPRPGDVLQGGRAVVGAGRFAAFLVLPAVHLHFLGACGLPETSTAN